MCRCYQRGYKFAGLLQKWKCLCAHTVNDSPEARDIRKRLCSKTCPGDESQTCGNNDRLDIWTTGLVRESQGFVFIDHHHHHQSLNREGRWGTTDDFATSFLHFSLFSTALWDLANSRPVHSLMLSSHLFLCLPCLLSPFTVPCKMVLARPDEQ